MSKLKVYQDIIADIERQEIGMRKLIDDLLDDVTICMSEKEECIKSLSDMLEELPKLKEEAIEKMKKYL
jgi:uncharacterized protein (DUF342 family)